MRNSLLLTVGVVLVLAVGGWLSWISQWPVNFVGVLATLLLAVILGWFALRQWLAQRRSGESGTPGEVEIGQFLARRKSRVFQMLVCILVSLLGFGLSLVGYLRLPLPLDLLSVFPLLGFPALAAMFGSVMVRAMADVGWWFVRLPENTALPIERDGAFWMMLINCNNPERRAHYLALANWHNTKRGYKAYVVLPPGKSFHFFGLFAWPWKVKLKTPWYEHEGDASNPTREPVSHVNLKIRPWNIYRETKDWPAGQQPEQTVPVIRTHDPVDVEIDLYIRLWCFDPYLAAYGTDFAGESIVSELVTVLREVVAGQYYFAKKEDKEAATGSGDESVSEKEQAVILATLELNPEIQQEIHQKLLARIGLADEDGHGTLVSLEPKVIYDQRFNRYRLDNPFSPGSAADICLSDCGFVLLSVRVTDIDPVGPVKDAMTKKSIALAEGAATLAKTRGEAAAIRVKADAEADAISARAKAISEPGGREVLEADVAEAVSGKVGELTVLVGANNSGVAGGAATLAATLAALGGLSVKQESPPPSPSYNAAE